MHLFEVRGRLGRGGAGEALLAHGPDGPCALKCVQLSGLQASECRNAIREVHLLRRLEHPNILQIHDAFLHHQHLILVCELCDAGDLEGLISRRRDAMPHNGEGVSSSAASNSSGFSEKMVLGIFAQAARALEYIHRQNIVHGDLKSSNIMLTKRGIAKVGDFGVAAPRNVASASRPSEGLAASRVSGKRITNDRVAILGDFVGSVHYMPPEVCDGGARTMAGDCWALGVVLYEMCSLNLPFVGSNLLAVTLQITQGKFKPLSADYSEELRALCSDLLSPEPCQRPTAAEVVGQTVVRSVWKASPAAKPPGRASPAAPCCRAEVLQSLAQQQPLAKVFGPSEYERFLLHQLELAE